jgi:hypothetical protein
LMPGGAGWIEQHVFVVVPWLNKEPLRLGTALKSRAEVDDRLAGHKPCVQTGRPRISCAPLISLRTARGHVGGHTLQCLRYSAGCIHAAAVDGNTAVPLYKSAPGSIALSTLYNTTMTPTACQ